MSGKLLAFALLLATAFPAFADTFEYVNESYGTRVTVPLDYFDSVADPSGQLDGRTFRSDTGATLRAYGQPNETGLTAPALLDLLVEAGERNGLPVTYKASGKSWVVVSGYDEETIYYERYEFGRSGVIHAMSLRYPVAVRATYDPLVGDIANSLQGP